MGKYNNLAAFLSNQEENKLVLRFTQIENILVFLLPTSARKHTAWWSNNPKRHTHAVWIGVGWKTSKVDIDKEVVTFIRNKNLKPSSLNPTSHPSQINHQEKISGHQFQQICNTILEEKWGKRYTESEVEGVPKRFDFVSTDQESIGDAKYYTMVKGQNIPPAKFSVIAEHIWLLEKTKAMHKFLIFGNDIRVPQIWFKKYGHLVIDVEFYFLDIKTKELKKIN